MNLKAAWLPLVALAGCAAGDVASNETEIPTTDPEPMTVVTPTAETTPVSVDADDPAVWVHPTDPNLSLIFGTDKAEEVGGLYWWDLAGRELGRIEGIDRPNNVDVHSFTFADGLGSIAVLTERIQRRLRVFRIDHETRELTDVTGQTAVFQNREDIDDARAPMGIALLKLGEETHAIVAPKQGPEEGYLDQYRLVENDGLIDVEYVRSFGAFSGDPDSEIEAIVADDQTGRVTYADESHALRTYDLTGEPELVLEFGRAGYEGDREGLALWTGPNARYLLSVDQISGGSEIHVFDAGLAFGDELGVVPIDADDTDGLEVIAVPTDLYPVGAAIAMNSEDRTFRIYDMRDLFAELPLPELTLGPPQ